MNGYNLDQLIKMWSREELSTEQAVGQVLLQLQTITTRLGSLEKRVEKNQKENGDPPKK